jgi:chromosome segregation ATPase
MSWLFGKKNPSSPAPKQGGGDQTPPSADELVRDVKKEFERRLEALSDSLQLQSEENTQLAKQLEDERTQGKEYQKKIAKLELDLEEEREVGKELQRRLEAMARVLEDVVMQQQTPAQFQKPYEDERFPSQDDLSKAKVQRSASGGLSPREKPSDIVTASAKPTQPEETEVRRAVFFTLFAAYSFLKFGLEHCE